MGELVLVYGRSGSGKSRSLMNFAEDEIFLVNTIGKRLPFRKKFAHEYAKDDSAHIIHGMQKAVEAGIKTIIIDDSGYIMSNKFMRGHSEKKSKDGTFEFYNDIADSYWRIINTAKNLPDDVITYLVLHEGADEFGNVKLRLIGKLLEDKVNIEGEVTIALHCVIRDGKHVFLTNKEDDTDICKSPEGMFENEIDNDLKMVDTTIREYYGL